MGQVSCALCNCGSFLRWLSSSGCPIGGNFLGSHSGSAIQSSKLVLLVDMSLLRAAPCRAL